MNNPHAASVMREIVTPAHLLSTPAIHLAAALKSHDTGMCTGFSYIQHVKLINTFEWVSERRLLGMERE
jgi:hypothetical protein